MDVIESNNERNYIDVDNNKKEAFNIHIYDKETLLSVIDNYESKFGKITNIDCLNKEFLFKDAFILFLNTVDFSTIDNLSFDCLDSNIHFYFNFKAEELYITHNLSLDEQSSKTR